MRISLVSGLAGLTLLAACGAAVLTPDNHTNHAPVCQEQSDWARSGKVSTGDIRITCPVGFVGTPQGTAPAPDYANEYNRNADIYRAGFAGALAVSTSR